MLHAHSCKAVAPLFVVHSHLLAVTRHHIEGFLTSSVLCAGKVFEANLQDPRFKSLFTSADYALDPTDPRFQQADGSSTIAKAVSKQRQQHTDAAGSAKAVDTSNLSQAPNAVQQHTEVMPGVADAIQLKSMIASLKRKAGKTSVVPAKAGKTMKQKKKKQRVT